MATRTTIPHNPHNSQFQRGVFASKLGAAKYYRQFVKPWEFFPQSGTCAVADLNGTNKVEGITSMTTADGAITLQPIPTEYDRTQDIYLRALFATANTANKNPTWLIKYLPHQLGDTFDTEPFSVALDDALGASTDGSASDEDKVRATVYGRIAAGAFDDNDFFLSIEVECDANGGATDWYLIGMEILWPRIST